MFGNWNQHGRPAASAISIIFCTCLLGFPGLVEAETCYSVYSGSNELIFQSKTPPVAMDSLSIGAAVERRFPGGSMQYRNTYACSEIDGESNAKKKASEKAEIRDRTTAQKRVDEWIERNAKATLPQPQISREAQALRDENVRKQLAMDAERSRTITANALEIYEKPRREEAERYRLQQIQDQQHARDQLTVDTNNRVLEIQRSQAEAAARNSRPAKLRCFQYGAFLDCE